MKGLRSFRPRPFSPLPPHSKGLFKICLAEDKFFTAASSRDDLLRSSVIFVDLLLTTVFIYMVLYPCINIHILIPMFNYSILPFIGTILDCNAPCYIANTAM